MKNISLLSLALFLTFNGMSTTNTLDPTEDAIYMLEEERMAMEVYQAFFLKWEHHAFQNISQAEARHLEIMKNLLIQMNPDSDLSIDKWETGVYQNTDLQNLYDDLVQRGSVSIQDALKVGAEIEELNIKDLKNAINRSESDIQKSTYQSLSNASYKHLRSFVRNIEKSGESYEPVLLDKEEFESIIERGSDQKVGGKKTCNKKNKNSTCIKSCADNKRSKNRNSTKCGKS